MHIINYIEFFFIKFVLINILLHDLHSETYYTCGVTNMSPVDLTSVISCTNSSGKVIVSIS